MNATTLSLFIIAIAFTSCHSWCIDSDGKACWFNVRSKSQDGQMRGIKFWDSKGTASAALAVTPAKDELTVMLGGDVAASQCMRLSKSGFLKLGQAAAPAEFALDIETTNEVATISVAGYGPSKGGACSALRLADLPTKSSVNLFHDAKSKVFALSFNNARQPLEAQQASFQISNEAPPKSFSIDENGALVLSQSGNAQTKYPRLYLSRSRGMSEMVPQIVFKDDVLGSIEYLAYDGSNPRAAASISALVDGAVAAGKISSKLVFSVSDSSANPQRDSLPSSKATLTANSFRLERGVELQVTSGDVQIDSGDLKVTEGTSFLSKISVAGPAIFAEGLTLHGGDLVVDAGTVTFKGRHGMTLEEGDLTISKGKIISGGNLEIGGEIKADSIANIAGDTTIGGDLDVAGKLVTMRGSLDVLERSNFASDIHVSGSARMNQQLTLSRDALLKIEGENEESFLLADPQKRTVEVDGQVIITGGLTSDKLRLANGGLSVEGTGGIAVNGELNVGGQTSLAGDVIVASETESTSSTSGALVVNGGVGVGGSLTISEGIYIGSKQIALEESSDGLLIRGSTTVMGSFQIFDKNEDNQAILNVNDQGHVYIKHHLNVDGDLDIGGNLKVSSLLAIEKVNFAKDLDVEGKASFKGDLELSRLIALGDSQFLGNVNLPQSDINLLEGKVIVGNQASDGLITQLDSSGISISDTLTVTESGLHALKAASFDDTVEISSGVLSLGRHIFENGENKPHIEFQTNSVHSDIKANIGNLNVKALDGELKNSAKNDISLVTTEGDIILNMEHGAFSVHTQNNVFKLDNDHGLTLTTKDGNVLARIDESDASFATPIKSDTIIATRFCGRESNDDSLCARYESNGTTFHISNTLHVYSSDEAVSINGTLGVVGPIFSASGVIIEPMVVIAQSIVELESNTGYIQLIDPESGPFSGPILLALPLEAQPGQQVVLQNSASAPAQVVQRAIIEGQVKVDTVTDLPLRATVQVIFDGTQWNMPSIPHFDSVALRGVHEFTASANLDIGNFTLSAAGIRIKDLKTPFQADEECVADDQLVCEPQIVPKGHKLAVIDNDGSLTTDRWATLDEDGTLSVRQLSGTMISGDINMAGNQLQNVSLVGGSIRGITEFQVAAGMLVGGAVSESSDFRLKSNITSIDPTLALETVKQLRGVRYRDIKSGDPHIGVIAQEVRSLVPEVVSLDEPSGFFAVRYARLVPLLLESIKALETRVAELERKLQT